MEEPAQMRLVLFSFGYKYGTPVDANMVLDVRFLPNPYYQEELRPKTGKEADVAGYVLDSEKGKKLFSYLAPLLHFLVAQNLAEGKEVFRVGIGCTGGRHRSVAVSEKIAELLRKQKRVVTLFHRDIAKDKAGGASGKS